MTYAFDAYKYTERDVRRDERLVAAATKYLEIYTGDYEYLLMVREIHLSGTSLTVNIIKGVLNCMKGDPEGYRLLPPKAVGVALAGREDVEEPAGLPQKKRRLEVVKEKTRPWIIEGLKQTFHGAYLLSMHQTAQVAHYLDHEKTSLIYLTDLHRGYPHGKPSSWYFRPFAFCGSKTSETHRIAKTDWGRRMCPTCVRVKESRDTDAMALLQTPPEVEDTREWCYHCGRLIDLGYTGRAEIFGWPVCSPNTTTELDCHSMVTKHGEGLGSRRGR